MLMKTLLAPGSGPVVMQLLRLVVRVVETGDSFRGLNLFRSLLAFLRRMSKYNERVWLYFLVFVVMGSERNSLRVL